MIHIPASVPPNVAFSAGLVAGIVLALGALVATQRFLDWFDARWAR